MIELPPPGGEYRPDDWAPQRPGRRRIGWTIAVLAVVLIAVVALINRQRASVGSTHAGSPGSARTAGPQASPSNSPGPSDSSNGGNSGPAQQVACPLIRDEQSHLAYRCIDNYLRQDGADIYLGLRIALNHEVEPGWVISEGSGDPTSVVEPPNDTVLGAGAAPILRPGKVSPLASPTRTPSVPLADVQREVQRRTGLALQKAYGDSPSTRTISAATRALSGVTGFEQVTEITINPAYRQAHGLTAKTERLWVLGLPSPSGVSIFMMSIPDERSDLWPRAEATVGTVHVI